VLLALVTSVVSAVSAARLLRLMFVERPDEGDAPVRLSDGAARAAVGFCALATLLLGVLAQPIFALAAGYAGTVH
jgi:NADH:ubiquinone oxidoreductase subunit 2 (subunit N)